MSNQTTTAAASSSSGSSNNNNASEQRKVPSPPNITDGNINNFWRCKKCAKVNFRTASLCSGCDAPMPPEVAASFPTLSSQETLSPASAGYLRSTAAISVNAKVADLQALLEDQRKKYEGDVITLRKQLDHALQAHNSLLSSQRQYSTSSSAPVSPSVSGGAGGGNSASSLEAGFQEQISLLQKQQQQAIQERDSSRKALENLKEEHQELVETCEAAASQYASAMVQLEESEKAREALMDKLKEPAVQQPPHGTTVQGSSSAVLNLEREVANLKTENSNLRSKVDELQTVLEKGAPSPGELSHRASMDTLKGANHSSSSPPESDPSFISLTGSTNVAATAGSSADFGSAGATEVCVENLHKSLVAKYGSALSPEVEHCLSELNTAVQKSKSEYAYSKQNNNSLKKQLDDCVADIENMESGEKDKALEWEREKEQLKRKIAQVEKDLHDADGRERDACLTMNAMDAILSDALYALRSNEITPTSPSTGAVTGTGQN